jgi:cell division protein ZapA
MAQVNLLINGHDYRLACADGEEAHLRALVARLDGQLTDLKKSFGEIGENRLTVMAAITLTDELEEARRNAKDMEAELALLRARAQPVQESKTDDAEEIIAEAFLAAAERIERLTASLNAGPLN